LPELAAWLRLPTRQELTSTTPLALAAAWTSITTETPNIEHFNPLGDGNTDGQVEADGADFYADMILLRAAKCEGGVVDMVADAVLAYDLFDPNSRWKAFACLLSGTGLRLQGLLEGARVALREGYGRSVVDMPVVAALCASEQAWLGIDEQDWDSAGDSAVRARLALDEHGLTRGCAPFATWSVSAWVSARSGETDLARHYVQKAVAASSDLKGSLVITPVLAEARVSLAHALLLLGDVRSARRNLNEAEVVGARLGGFDAFRSGVADIRSVVDAAYASTAAIVPLTPAELRVLRYLPTYLSFNAIARDLILSTNTVKTQAIAIYRKLGVSSRADAVQKAKEQGLLPA
jgi:LuxR family maltose regulon positive regulatory protein